MLSFPSRTFLVAAATISLVACGSRSEVEPETADGSAAVETSSHPPPDCGWSSFWSSPPNDCTWHAEFSGDPLACTGFPLGAGTLAQCEAACAHDQEGDTADSCNTIAIGYETRGYMLTCSTASADAGCTR